MKQLTNFDRNVILIVGIEPPNILDVAGPQIHLLLLIKVLMYFSMVDILIFHLKLNSFCLFR